MSWRENVCPKWIARDTYLCMFVRFVKDQTSTDGHSVISYNYGVTIGIFQSYYDESSVRFTEGDIYTEEFLQKLKGNVSPKDFGFTEAIETGSEYKFCYYTTYPL